MGGHQAPSEGAQPGPQEALPPAPATLGLTLPFLFASLRPEEEG